MSSSAGSPGEPPALDPRSGVEGARLSPEGLRPAVARAGPPAGGWLVGGAAVLIGGLVFLWLSSHRPGPPRALGELAARGQVGAAAPAVPPPPKELDALEDAARGELATPPAPAPPPAPTPPALAIVTPAPSPVSPLPPAAAPPVVATVDPAAQRRRAPSLVVDFGDAPAPKPAAGAAGAAGRAPTLSGDEQFASRVTVTEPERSRATFLRNRGATVPQGAMIPAVLETALNSDLPGFTRAVVSRDVRSFDGSQVLIPRGSRVIGQYRSGVALGASRAFVIWTRVLRPDGATVQIGSSGADTLGRAGLAGKVDRHFFERFGGAVLLSVVNLGGQALVRGNSTQVVIGSSSDASSLAGAASAFTPQNISPTITVAQGTPIRIFVARDLDFSSTEEPQP